MEQKTDVKADYKDGNGTKFVIIHDKAHLLPYWSKKFERGTDRDLFTTRAQAERAVTRLTTRLLTGKSVPTHIKKRAAEARKWLELMDRSQK